MLSKLFINNDIRPCGLSQHVDISATEVSDVDVDFTEAVLMLILYQQHSPIDYLLVLIIVDHIDIAGLGHHVKDFYHTDDYQVDISYAAYWIKNLLSIFEKEAF